MTDQPQTCPKCNHNVPEPSLRFTTGTGRASHPEKQYTQCPFCHRALERLYGSQNPWHKQ